MDFLRIMVIMWIQLTSVMKSCLVTNASGLVSQVATSSIKTGIFYASTLFCMHATYMRLMLYKIYQNWYLSTLIHWAFVNICLIISISNIHKHTEEIIFSYFLFWNIWKMPDYTPNNIVDIILMLGECRCSYNKQQNYIVIVFLTDNTQMIEPLHDLCCVNNNIQFKDILLIYLREMIRKLLQLLAMAAINPHVFIRQI